MWENIRTFRIKVVSNTWSISILFDILSSQLPEYAKTQIFYDISQKSPPHDLLIRFTWAIF